MIETARRPFWKRKRWIAAAVMRLVVAYPLSLGPVGYAIARDWVPPLLVSVLAAAYEPLDLVIMNDMPGTQPLSDYSLWAYQLGQRHFDAN